VALKQNDFRTLNLEPKAEACWCRIDGTPVGNFYRRDWGWKGRQNQLLLIIL
jgi:hypothetical protein